VQGEGDLGQVLRLPGEEVGDRPRHRVRGQLRRKSGGTDGERGEGYVTQPQGLREREATVDDPA
jgi:hypothetical protein